MARLAHVEDGGLPEHVERARTHVSVERDNPKNTATVEYAGAYFAHGLDNSFDLERFRRQLTINLQHLDDDEVVFDIIGIDAAIANALRRILIAEVPTMAIEKVFVLQNTTMTEDEVLAHRLGLIPIRADPRRFRDHSADDDVDEHNVVAFRLAVKCEHKPGAGDGPPGSRTADLVNGQVLSSALQWIPQGDQETRFADQPIRPVHDDILITKMRPGQEILLEAWCERGIGKTHAKWSPVSTASYRLMPKVEIAAGLTADEARALHAKCPMGVFDIEDVAGVATAKVARPRNCSMCRECIREPGWEDKVKLLRQRDHFIFSIESTGVLPPDELFREATKVLLTKASELGALLKDSLAAQREDVGSGAL